MRDADAMPPIVRRPGDGLATPFLLNCLASPQLQQAGSCILFAADHAVKRHCEVLMLS